MARRRSALLREEHRDGEKGRGNNRKGVQRVELFASDVLPKGRQGGTKGLGGECSSLRDDGKRQEDFWFKSGLYQN